MSDSDSDIECDTCNRSFHNWHACRQHMTALNHWAPRYDCETCDSDFASQGACNQHMNALNHWASRYECEACNNRYSTPQDARRHMDAASHWRKHFCNECKRGFQNENNLRQHLNGREHRSSESLLCPFCRKGFVSATGISTHLETGSCPNARNVNREVIYNQIRQMDTSGLITHKQLTWHSKSNSDLIATERSYNGDAYECYLCHAEFWNIQALNQHLQSPRHKQKIYHCVKRSCKKEFTALAGLFNHLESESCGATRFETVQRNVTGIISGQRLLAF